MALNVGVWLAFLTCAAVRCWATLYVGGHKDRELQTEGPYSICRNPLYFGSLSFGVALTCILKSALFAGGVILTGVFYLVLVVRAEELWLVRRFGEDYQSYCRRTPRFWPRWSSFRTPPSVKVELRQLRQEIIRLGRAAAVLLVLQVVMQMRATAWWPHWFNFL